MGRPSKTASPTITTPPAPVGQSKAVVAFGPTKSAVDQSPQRSEADLLKSFEALPGIMPASEEEEIPEAKEKTLSERQETRTVEIDDEETEIETKSKKEEKPAKEKSKALLPDEDEEEESEESDDDEETEPEGKTKNEDVAKKLFKARQKKRELKEALAAEKTRAAELESKLNGVLTSAAPVGELFTGFYEGVKTPDDLNKVKDHLQKWVDYLEDNSDGYTHGETEIDAKEAKAQLRAYRNELKRASKVESFFENRDKSAAKAKDLYPWVSNTASKRHDIVLNLAKEYPEVARSAHSALLLGRLSLASLVESGEYTLVKKGAVTAPAKEKVTFKPVSRAPIETEQEPPAPIRQKAKPPTAQDLEARFAALWNS